MEHLPVRSSRVCRIRSGARSPESDPSVKSRNKRSGANSSKQYYKCILSVRGGGGGEGGSGVKGRGGEGKEEEGEGGRGSRAYLFVHDNNRSRSQARLRLDQGIKIHQHIITHTEGTQRGRKPKIPVKNAKNLAELQSQDGGHIKPWELKKASPLSKYTELSLPYDTSYAGRQRVEPGTIE